MSGRVLKRDSVFLTDPDTLAVSRFVAGDEIPSRFQVGDHLFTVEPEWAGTPQQGTFGLVPPVGPGPVDGPAGFDPGEHTVDEVLDYVGDDDPALAGEVLAAEQAGKNRKGVVEQLAPLADPSQ